MLVTSLHCDMVVDNALSSHRRALEHFWLSVGPLFQEYAHGISSYSSVENTIVVRVHHRKIAVVTGSKNVVYYRYFLNWSDKNDVVGHYMPCIQPVKDERGRESEKANGAKIKYRNIVSYL